VAGKTGIVVPGGPGVNTRIYREHAKTAKKHI
jgi:hypothetical protein